MSKRVLFLFSGAIFFGILLATYFLTHTNELYGNDRESIIQVIKSIDGYENDLIKVLSVHDYHDIRIVAFLANNSPGYIRFVQNDNGDYLWDEIQVHRGESFALFLPNLTVSKGEKLMVVTNNESNVAKMQVTVNGITMEEELNPNKASVTWIDLPPTSDGHYTFSNYKYYDENGDLIN